jgi:hypothetical protein
MKARCYNPKSTQYAHYGGRGITVCERWKNSFQAFYEDMGPRPSGQYTVERRDVNAGYTPENCYWATWAEQNINKRTIAKVSIDGKARTVTQWAEHFGISRTTIERRLKRGWSIEKAITTPATRGHHRAVI